MSAAPSRHAAEPEPRLRGPRPQPLRLINKESHKIGKQKAAPPPPAAAQCAHPPPPPVIIYTVSPKVFRIEPEDFMSVVQRLTGSNASSSSSSLNTPPPPPPPAASSANDGGVSAAAQMGSTGDYELPGWREMGFSNGGVEIGRNLRWNEINSDPMSYLHGNRNVNNVLEDNMNMPSSSSSSNILDVFNYFSDI